MHLKRPIVHFSMLKSGTHWMREILKQLTGADYYEPDVEKNGANYQDDQNFCIPTGAIYSWHLYPTSKTLRAVDASSAKVIVLVRNLFDQSISLYNHFALNIDSEIGRGRNVAHLFSGTEDEPVLPEIALSKIIVGCNQGGFYWRGLQHQYLHLLTLHTFSERSNCLFVTYEDLILDPLKTIGQIASFLDEDIAKVDTIIQRTSFERMKTEKPNKSHFVRGQVGSYLDYMESYPLIKELFESVSASFEPIDGYGYLTNLKDLSRLVSSV